MMMSGKFSKLIGARTTRNVPNETDPEFVSENLEQRKSQATCVKSFKAKLRFREDQQDILLIIKDKSAVHVSWRYHLELRTNGSQTGATKGFGGIIGEDTKVLYKSAADGDYQAKLPQNEFEGKFDLQMDKQDKSVLVKAEHGTAKTDRKDVGRIGGYVENLTKKFESMTPTDSKLRKKPASPSLCDHFAMSVARADVDMPEWFSGNDNDKCITLKRDSSPTLCSDDPCDYGIVDINLQFSDCCDGLTPFDQIKRIFKCTVNQDPNVDLVVLFTCQSDDSDSEVLTVTCNHDNQVYFKSISSTGAQINNDSIFYRVSFFSCIPPNTCREEIIWINLATLLPITVTLSNDLHTNHPNISSCCSGLSTPDSDESCEAATANNASCFHWLYDVLRCQIRSHYFRISGTSCVAIYPADRTPTDRISKADTTPDTPAIIDHTSLEFCVRTVCGYVEINC